MFSKIKEKIKKYSALSYVLLAQKPFNPDLLDKSKEQTDAFRTASGFKAQPLMFSHMITNVIMALLSILGLVFIGLIVYGGYQWLTARGNEQQVEKAKDTITHAIWGIIITLSAYAIGYFILSFIMSGAVGATP